MDRGPWTVDRGPWTVDRSRGFKFYVVERDSMFNLFARLAAAVRREAHTLGNPSNFTPVQLSEIDLQITREEKSD